MSKAGRLVANLGLLVFTLALGLAGGELALRVIFARSLDFGMEMWKYSVRLKRPVPDPQLSFVHAPNTDAFLMGADVHINSQGLRDSEYPLAKGSGTYRIMILGDSTSFGWGVRQEDTVAKILERDLNQNSAGCRFEVINTGIGNYDTVQEVTYYKTRGRAFHPDLVILEYFINDAEPVPKEKRGFLLDQSYLFAFATQRLDGLLRLTGQRSDWKQYYASLYQDHQPGYQAMKAALVDLTRTTRTEGSRLLVAILPELHQIDTEYPFVDAHNKVKAVMVGQGVPVVDLIDGLRGHGPESTLWVTPQDAHPNAKANHLIAEQIHRRIAQPDLRLPSVPGCSSASARFPSPLAR